MVAVGYKLGFEENDEELNLGDSGARGNTAPDSRGEYVRSMVNGPRGSLGANGLGGSRWATTDSNIGVENPVSSSNTRRGGANNLRGRSRGTGRGGFSASGVSSEPPTASASGIPVNDGAAARGRLGQVQSQPRAVVPMNSNAQSSLFGDARPSGPTQRAPRTQGRGISSAFTTNSNVNITRGSGDTQAGTRGPLNFRGPPVQPTFAAQQSLPAATTAQPPPPAQPQYTTSQLLALGHAGTELLHQQSQRDPANRVAGNQIMQQLYREQEERSHASQVAEQRQIYMAQRRAAQAAIPASLRSRSSALQAPENGFNGGLRASRFAAAEMQAGHQADMARFFERDGGDGLDDGEMEG